MSLKLFEVQHVYKKDLPTATYVVDYASYWKKRDFSKKKKYSPFAEAATMIMDMVKSAPTTSIICKVSCPAEWLIFLNDCRNIYSILEREGYEIFLEMHHLYKLRKIEGWSLDELKTINYKKQG